MKKYGVPTADYATFDSLEPALSHLKQHGVPIVIKADGLAAGKGVTVAFDIASAQAALADIFSGSQGKVVIEEFLDGRSFLYLVLFIKERFIQCLLLKTINVLLMVIKDQIQVVWGLLPVLTFLKK